MEVWEADFGETSDHCQFSLNCFKPSRVPKPFEATSIFATQVVGRFFVNQIHLVEEFSWRAEGLHAAARCAGIPGAIVREGTMGALRCGFIPAAMEKRRGTTRERVQSSERPQI